MKFFTVGLALFAVAACAVAQNYPSSEYLPPPQDIGIPSNEYLAPIAPAAPITQYSSGVLADDGYRYKTVKRFRSRHRRDVSELPLNEYLPPVQQQVSLPQESYAPISSYAAPSNEYLAPIAPAAPIAQYSSGVLADDGYRYKTVKRFRTARRFRSRHRRDVNELPLNEYLPPAQEQVSFQQESYAPISSYAAPSNEYLAPIAPAAPITQYSSGVLADDGYRYKTVKRFRTAKRFRSRHRRDVNELPLNEYLPPVQEQVSFQQESYAPISSYAAPSNEYLAPIAPAAPITQYSSGVLADDGYRYKTVKRFRTARRFRSRHRRDVNELPLNEYLPPVQQQVSFQQESYAPISSYAVPSNEYLAPIAPAAPIAQYSSGVLADDGYRYKTVKRFRSRHRRDVSELPLNEYLPPQASYAPISSYAAPSNEYLAPIAPAESFAQYSSGAIADDGYRYRTVKRFRTARRYRSRH